MRKCKLTPEQMLEIERRLLAGESRRSVARSFNVGESTLRYLLAEKVETIRNVAGEFVRAERALRELPAAAQISAMTLVEQLRATSEHLASAARYNAQTAHRLAGIAAEHAANLDDVAPDGSILENVARLTALSNEAAKTGLNLIAVNKDKNLDAAPKKVKTLKDFYADVKPGA